MATTISASDTGATAAKNNRRHLGVALLVIATAQLMIVLDATVVNVALPHIQRALGFSGSGLEWVINAYALTLGGLLLLGGRAGDLLGRRRMFIIGLLLFSAASLLGGFATSQAWLLTARAVQGAGGAIVAPTALALIANTFPAGPARNRAMGVYAAMSGIGGAIGLIAGGLLVTYANWRWVLFVNVPIGIAVALAAPAVLPDTARRPGRFDLPGAITGTAGVAALVYGLSSATATSPGGSSYWGSAKVVSALAAGAVLLAAFAVIETRSRHALLPVRLLRSRDRAGANLIMLGAGTAIFGVFFFITLFAQEVWGYSALRTGLSFLPLTVALVAASIVASTLVQRLGARPLLLTGSVAAAGGMYWLSRITEHGSYAGGLLGPSLVVGLGLGLLFVPLPLISMTGVAESESGAAASLLNVGRQVGGALGLAVIGTVAWTVVANSTRAQSAGALRAVGHAASPAAAASVQAAVRLHALAAGFDRAFLVAAAISLLMLVVTVTMIRVRRADLVGG
ncbi:MAG: MFS transporter [Trebonia sp.]|jgi:EmrB/QacA subfamily drug resistance transporter